MSTQDVLALVGREKPESVVVIYFEDHENIVLTCSNMTNAEALWALEQAKRNVLGY